MLERHAASSEFFWEISRGKARKWHLIQTQDNSIQKFRTNHTKMMRGLEQLYC